MNGIWNAVGDAQQAGIAASSAWNASYFVRRAMGAGSRARRVAAGLLALLFVAVALEAVAGLPVASGAGDAARRVPLLLATTGVALLVSYPPRPTRAARTTGGVR